MQHDLSSTTTIKKSLQLNRANCYIEKNAQNIQKNVLHMRRDKREKVDRFPSLKQNGHLFHFKIERLLSID